MTLHAPQHAHHGMEGATTQRRIRGMISGRGVWAAACCGLLLLLLLPPAVTAVSTAPSSLPTIAIHSSIIYSPIVRRALHAYQLEVPSFSSPRVSLVEGQSLVQGLEAGTSNKFEFIVMTSAVPPANKHQLPDHLSYPIMINGVAPFHNVAGVASGELRMTMQAMCQIMRGNITHWDDPRIKDRNPTLPLPSTPITFLALNFGSDTMLTVVRLCNKVDLEWRTLPGLGLTNMPDFGRYIPRERMLWFDTVQSVAGMASTLVDTPGAFAINAQATVLQSPGAKNVALINQAGQTVLPTADSMSQTASELAMAGIIAGGNNFDLTNPQSSLGWPIVSCGWVWIPRTKALSTCASKKATLEFLLWMYESPIVASAAAAAYTPMLSDLYLSQSGLLRRIASEVLCTGGGAGSDSEGELLIQSTRTVALLSGNALIAGSMSFVASMYSGGVDSALSYSYTAGGVADGLVLQRLAGNEVDLGFVVPAALGDGQLREFTRDIQLVDGVTPLDSAVLERDSLGNEVPLDPDRVTVREGGMLLPLFLTGVVVTFELPGSLLGFSKSWNAGAVYDLGDGGAPRALPPLLPLRISMEFAARAFLGSGVGGNASSSTLTWLDPEFVSLNPHLPEWFAAIDAASTSGPLPAPTMSTVVCCTDPTDTAVATTLLSRNMMRTAHVRQSLPELIPVTESTEVAEALLRAQLVLWGSLRRPVAGQMMIDREVRMAGKMATSPGTLGYKMLTRESFNPATDFVIVTNGASAAASGAAAAPVVAVGASISSMRACVQPFLSDPSLMAQMLSPFTGRFWGSVSSAINGNAHGCYPLVETVWMALPRAASAGSSSLVSSASSSSSSSSASSSSVHSVCGRAKKNLELARWLHTSPLLTDVSIQAGLVRLSAEFLPIRLAVMNHLNAATCDGRTQLVTLPLVWSMPTAAHVVAIVALTVLALLALVSGGALWHYRSMSYIRGSSPLFLGMVLVGIVLTSVSLISWTSEPGGGGRCTAFMWLGNLGFTLVFAPLFAKTWRIYQIFSGKKIKIVKISNHKLGGVVAAVLLVDVVLLAIWTGVSPLKPVLFIRDPTTLDGAFEHTTMCAPDGDAGYALLAVEAVFKGALLFFGALMGFSTRKVASAYNESSGIAWSIYNTVLAGVVVAALIASLDTIGDTLVWLVLFMLLWVMCCTWAFIFVPKAQAIWSTLEGKVVPLLGTEIPSTNTTNGTQGSSSNFSFASIALMPLDRLAQYAKALRSQLERVERRMQSSGAPPAQYHVAGSTPTLQMRRIHEGAASSTLDHSDPSLPHQPSPSLPPSPRQSAYHLQHPVDVTTSVPTKTRTFNNTLAPRRSTSSAVHTASLQVDNSTAWTQSSKRHSKPSVQAMAIQQRLAATALSVPSAVSGDSGGADSVLAHSQPVDALQADPAQLGGVDSVEDGAMAAPVRITVEPASTASALETSSSSSFRVTLSQVGTGEPAAAGLRAED